MESQEFPHKKVAPQNRELSKSPDVSVEQEKPPENFK